MRDAGVEVGSNKSDDTISHKSGKECDSFGDAGKSVDECRQWKSCNYHNPKPFISVQFPMREPRKFPNSLFCTGTTPTHQDNRHPECSRLEYLTGKLASIKNLKT